MKIFFIIIIFLLAIAFCSSGGDKSETKTSQSKEIEQTQTATPTPTEATKLPKWSNKTKELLLKGTTGKNRELVKCVIELTETKVSEYDFLKMVAKYGAGNVVTLMPEMHLAVEVCSL